MEVDDLDTGSKGQRDGVRSPVLDSRYMEVRRRGPIRRTAEEVEARRQKELSEDLHGSAAAAAAGLHRIGRKQKSQADGEGGADQDRSQMIKIRLRVQGGGRL